MNPREQLLATFSQDRIYAHEILFAHRHKDVTPEFHHNILTNFYSQHPRVSVEAFRGAAKSTLLEEYILLTALFRECNFALVVGNAEGMTVPRLTSIKEELTNNDGLIELFDDQHGSTWTETEIVLVNGVKIQVLGARQSMRGVKHNDQRPDLVAVDDLEDEEMVKTPAAVLKNKRWFNGTLRPAMDPKGKIRMLGTPLDPNCLIEQNMRNTEWLSLRVPIKYLDDNGEWVSTWGSRFPIEWINKLEQDYINDGSHTEFMQEYMCKPESAESKPFKPEMMPIPAQIKRSWDLKMAMVDPARKGKQPANVRQKIARTGYSVWSWVGTQLVVHKADADFDPPDQIVDKIFKIDDEFHPALIGVELDGLEEFLMQPIRNEMIKRGHSLPVIGVRAPRDKDSFILGMQPFYKAANVTYTKNFAELNTELLQFPTGRKDIPNALAYAFKLRPGRAVYPDFEDRHVAEALFQDPKQPFFLLVNARAAMTGAVLCQFIYGGVRVIQDWVKEAPPMECLEEMVTNAQLLINGKMKIYTPQEQYAKYTNHGIPAAARGARFDVQPVHPAAACSGNLKQLLQKMVNGEPAFQVDMESRWVLNGMAGAYARASSKDGSLQDLPEDNQYRLVIEAIEAFYGWFSVVQSSGDIDQTRHYATGTDGKRFLTTLPGRAYGGRR